MLSVGIRKVADDMTEWTFASANLGGQNDYDISNIQRDSAPQQIIPDSGSSIVTCTSETCPFDQAYRPGDTTGTCSGTGPKNQAARACGVSGYTVVALARAKAMGDEKVPVRLIVNFINADTMFTHSEKR
ncbi:hypothetical protein C8R44DRAFT_883701 [Mycena epipterygia]|nr:hypothetical protein C8R44DRAFT_883701 [Mycena epipterygia]